LFYTSVPYSNGITCTYRSHGDQQEFPAHAKIVFIITTAPLPLLLDTRRAKRGQRLMVWGRTMLETFAIAATAAVAGALVVLLIS
jgi:hypothetical protein